MARLLNGDTLRGNYHGRYFADFNARLSHKNKLSAEHNDHKILSANSQALLKGLMGPETRRNLCVFYTIIFYVSPDGGFT